MQALRRPRTGTRVGSTRVGCGASVPPGAPKPSPSPGSLAALARAPAALAAALLVSACYATFPVQPETVPPGEEVVIHLSPEASQRTSLEAGYNVRTLSGRLARVEEDSLSLSVFAGRRVQGMAVDNTRALYHFSRPDVVLMERRELHRERTLLLAGGIVGAVVFTVLHARSGGGPGPNPIGEPPPPSPGRIPLPRH
jgi:hypothetical protein